MRYPLVLVSVVFASCAAAAQPAPQQNQSSAASSASKAAATKANKAVKKQLPAPAAAPQEPVETEMVPELSERDRVMGTKN
jgi:hypothetical protein